MKFKVTGLTFGVYVSSCLLLNLQMTWMADGPPDSIDMRVQEVMCFSSSVAVAMDS